MTLNPLEERIKMVRKFFGTLMVIVGLMSFNATVANAAEVEPSPPVTGFDSALMSFPIIDEADIFTTKEEETLLVEFMNAYDNYDVVPVVETLVTLNGQDIEAYATLRANEFAVGDADKDKGIYILIVRDDRNFQFETGVGITRVVPSAVTQGIVDSAVIPQFKNGNFAAGIVDGVNAIGAEYQNPGVTDTTAAEPSSDATNVVAIVLWVIGGIVGLILLIIAVLFIVGKVQDTKERNERIRMNELEHARNILASNRTAEVKSTALAIIRDRKEEFINADATGRQKIIYDYVLDYLATDPDFKNIYKRVTDKVVEVLSAEHAHGLPKHWYPRVDALAAETTISKWLSIFDKASKKRVPVYKKHLVDAENARKAQAKKAEKERQNRTKAEKVWKSLSSTQKSKLQNASSRSHKEALLREYGASTAGSDMNVLLPLMFVMYASSMEAPRSSYSSSSSYDSSSSSYSSYSGSDYSSSSFDGGSFDGGGGGGSW